LRNQKTFKTMKITITIETSENESFVQPVNYESDQFRVVVNESKNEHPVPDPEPQIKPVTTQSVKTVTIQKTCVNCGKKFTQRHKQQSCCCDECKKEYGRKKQAEYSRKYYDSHPEKKYQAKGKTKQEPVPRQEQPSRRDENGHRMITLKSGEKLCLHCKEPFKVERFDQHFCSDSCEALHGKVVKSKF
jgi:hypothetical protein